MTVEAIDDLAIDRANVLLHRLVRLTTMKPHPLMAPGVRQRAIFWAYADCCDAGLTPKANLVLNMALGLPEERKPLPSGRIGVRAAAPLPDPNRCIHCGHKGTQHVMASIGFAAHCTVCDASYRIHSFEGGYVEELPPEPTADTCWCGHERFRHLDDGECVGVIWDDQSCACVAYQGPQL